MGTILRVRRVRLNDTALPHLWEFPDGITIIVGDSGGGKTSLLNLIQYGLGGSATITREITDAASGVTLDIIAGHRRLQLTRRFRENTVGVGEGDNPEVRHVLSRSAKGPLLSDRLLRALDIPIVRVRQARKRSKSTRLTSISFLDVFAYCYLDQEQVDRSTVFDNDPFRGPKRVSTFELLHRIIDAGVADLEVRRLLLQEEHDSRATRVNAVEEFVREQGLPIDSSSIDLRLEQISAEERELQHALLSARDDAERTLTVAGDQQDVVAIIEQRLALARTELNHIIAERGGIRRATNQLERDATAVRDGATARSALEPLPFVVCPRCEQALNGRDDRPDHCVVCLQPDPPAGKDDETALKQVLAQLAETRAMETQLAAAEEAASHEVDQLRHELRVRRLEISRLVAAASAPHLARASEIQERLGALRGERTALRETRPVTAAVQAEQDHLSAIAPELATLEDLEAERRLMLAPARERVEELSQDFERILRRFTLPWLRSAEVDRNSYLPRVNARSLRDLSSGGMKATTNVAYYLAVHVMAQRDREVLTPSFLMLDSIRKDLGMGDKDLARAELMYTYLRGLQDSRHQPGALAADFQLIVVDNDLPREFERTFHTILIDPDRPLIRQE